MRRWPATYTSYTNPRAVLGAVVGGRIVTVRSAFRPSCRVLRYDRRIPVPTSSVSSPSAWFSHSMIEPHVVFGSGAGPPAISGSPPSGGAHAFPSGPASQPHP